jgi:hypothetical protein
VTERQRIRRLARSFVRARQQLAAMEAAALAHPEHVEAACHRMFRTRERLVDAVLCACGHDVDEGPAVVDAGGLTVAVGVAPDNEGVPEVCCARAVVVFTNDQVVRRARSIARA